MPTRKLARLGLFCLALGPLLLVFLYPSDAERVRESADAILAAARTNSGQLALALERHATAEVSLVVEEPHAVLVGRQALVEAAHQLIPAPAFRLEAVEISVEGSRARLSADLISSVRAELPELRRPRHAVAVFEKDDAHFRLVSAEVGAARSDQPEARP